MVTGPDSASAVLAGVGELVESERFGARVTVVSGPSLGTSAVVDLERGVVAGTLPTEIANGVLADVRLLVERETAATLGYGDIEVFCDPIIPRPRILIFGAVHIAQALTDHASLLGYHVTVSDSRPVFLTAERFPNADELLVGWPDQIEDKLVLDMRTSVVVLSHDARFEDPLWPIVLPSSVRYIGAMGSRRTAARRRERLAESGFSAETIDRIHGPIGMDIGADRPGEVAISILAEMISLYRRPGDAPDLVGEKRPLARATTGG